MKASEAVEMSYEAAKDEIVKIFAMIKVAARKGEMHLRFNSQLNDAVKHALLNEGYEIEESSTGAENYIFETIIRWK